MDPTRVSETVVEQISIRAGAETIFEALTNPAARMQWWGREGRFQVTHIESDLRPEGKFLMTGTAMGGPFEVTGEYRQVERPRLLVFTWLPSWQGDNTESLVRFDLTEENSSTTVRLTHSGLTTEASRNTHRGWPQILASLRSYVERNG
jgi:uncharacterized protein YndB with AHSA1/START domain